MDLVGEVIVFLVSLQTLHAPAQYVGRCVGCDVTDADYHRGWIAACRQEKIVMKKYKQCVPSYFDWVAFQWKYRCYDLERPVKQTVFTCCPQFTLQYAWCILPPRPPPTSTTRAPVVTQSSTTCGRSKYSSLGARILYIIGGTTSRSHEFPWQVSIRLEETGRGGHLCGGCIISENYVLTAAHCAHYYRKFPALSKTVVVGEFDLDVGDAHEAIYNITEVIFYPGYNRRTINNDIALLRLDRPIQFNDDVRPICLPESGRTYARSPAIVSGWGAREYGGATSRLLQSARMVVMSNEECNERLWWYYMAATSQMLCASDGITLTQRDACQGDSGGPLTVQETDGRYTLIGLVSWGLGCAVGTPGVYTRVSEFVSWIHGYTGS